MGSSSSSTSTDMGSSSLSTTTDRGSSSSSTSTDMGFSSLSTTTDAGSISLSTTTDIGSVSSGATTTAISTLSGTKSQRKTTSPSTKIAPFWSTATSSRPQTTTSPKQTEVKQKCYNPITGKNYSVDTGFCIYGVLFYPKKLGDELYCNDEDYLSTSGSISYSSLTKAAKAVHNYLMGNEETNDTYHITWIKNDSGKYVDMFVYCCQKCPHYQTAQEWRILLKSQFLARRSSVIRSYAGPKQERSDGNEIFNGTYRQPEIGHLEICNNQQLRKVPVIGKSNVCYVTASHAYASVNLFHRLKTWNKTDYWKMASSKEALKMG
ncbi:unnamed protein product, partial [Gongylonema pulchrum]|uniref:Flo11 domain-containing protein n=1 Tax=Gongylonema pulchrum TaxID=637853 RepID=A0A183D3V4_9BILA